VLKVLARLHISEKLSPVNVEIPDLVLGMANPSYEESSSSSWNGFRQLHGYAR